MVRSLPKGAYLMLERNKLGVFEVSKEIEGPGLRLGRISVWRLGIMLSLEVLEHRMFSVETHRLSSNRFQEIQ